MKRRFLTVMASAIVVVLAVGCGGRAVQGDFTQYVNTLIGTDYTGNTYPGAQMPFGMVQLSPDNGLPGWDRIAGYFYPDSTIAGFSHTHLSGTGAGDLYDISFMPVTLPVVEDTLPLGVHSKFSHEGEIATAGYYKVHLDSYDIDVELTATERCGVQRYTFPEAKSEVILNLAKAMNWDATLDTKVEVVDSVTLKGYRISAGWARHQKVYFYSRFSLPFESVSLDTVAINDAEGNRQGTGTVAHLGYNTAKGDQLTIVTALSGVSEEGAEQNFKAEATKADFDAYREAARDRWNAELGKVKVETEEDSLKTVFYTALYHSMLAPTIYSDVDGQYWGPDKAVHKTEGVNYSTFSLWDTFRAAHPLFTITQPEASGDMVRSLVDFGKQNGRLPVWNMWGGETDMMIGYHSVPVIVDAYLKGIGGFDPEEALQVCVATANLDQYRGIGQYKKLGYVPYDEVDEYNADNWSMSRTLEYAFDDYCIAVMAEKLGKVDVAKEFYARSQNYKNTYNPATTWMQPRDSKGAFITPFSPDDYTPHICESNGWHYFWSVQHDVQGLIDLVGGAKAFEAKLDSMFTYNPAADADLPLFSTGMIGQYAQGNEPSHHVAYLYNAVGRPEKGAKYLNEIMRGLYNTSPAGLCGNEDCGQMSAWSVFSAMGFYPANPASGQYEIGCPLFPKVEISVAGGKKFTLIANGASAKNIYVQSVKVNGEAWHKSYITHEQILSGATVEIEMGAEAPAKAWWE